MAVHVREAPDLYSKEKRAWFSTNNDPESVEVYQLKRTRHSSWVLSPEQLSEVLRKQKLLNIGCAPGIQYMIDRVGALSTHKLSTIVRQRWGSAAMRSSIDILMPNFDRIEQHPLAAVKAARVYRFDSIREGETFMRKGDAFLVKFPLPNQSIAVQGLSWSRELEKGGYDGWTFASFGVARLVRCSTNEFKLDFAPGEILVNTSGSEFERFREWSQSGASSHT